MTSLVHESIDIPGLLKRFSAGDRAAMDELFAHLYRDIHAIAVGQLRHERHLTIRPTALVHEAYIRLAGLNRMRWQDRAHFLMMASRVTRQAMVDEARRRRASKRASGMQVTLSDTNLGAVDDAYDLLDVDRLLDELQSFDREVAEVASLRIFGGLSIEEVAEAMQISVATVNRRWGMGKAWLMRELTRGAGA
jgi:RNA polymerase sigma factor (TIGR02999 family)